MCLSHVHFNEKNQQNEYTPFKNPNISFTFSFAFLQLSPIRIFGTEIHFMWFGGNWIKWQLLNFVTIFKDIVSTKQNSWIFQSSLAAFDTITTPMQEIQKPRSKDNRGDDFSPLYCQIVQIKDRKKPNKCVGSYIRPKTSSLS